MNKKDINDAIVHDLADTIFGYCHSYNALFEDASESAFIFNKMYPDSAFPCVSDDLECYETVNLTCWHEWIKKKSKHILDMCSMQ